MHRRIDKLLSSQSLLGRLRPKLII